MFLRGTVSYAQAKGPRDYQEDRMLHLPFASKRHGRGHLLAAMDGHEGASVAQYCADFIPRLFNPDAPDVAEELKKIVAQLDARTALATAGSTLSIACIHESKGVVTTATLGDSPIIVIDRNGQIHLSEEHNVRTNVLEREAVVRRGGVYEEEGYVHNAPGSNASTEEWLQLSRALGDHALRNILNHTPAINEYRIGGQSVIIVASDGLLDPGHEQTHSYRLKSLIARVKDGSNAHEILEWRELQELEDNTSIIIWQPKKWWQWFL